MMMAEKAAEVEPFKTAITLKFDRQWWFVLYAVVLLVVNIFTRKVYCRYICPLGAGLAITGRFRLFDWLKRRKECGNPCQSCDECARCRRFIRMGTSTTTSATTVWTAR
ncbi:hypothetical protein SSTU70S_05374 [Stutzerimonas stutzeri]